MAEFFNQLKVGDELETRETEASPWMIVEVIDITGDSITMQNDEIGEVDSYKDEINQGIFFRPLN